MEKIYYKEYFELERSHWWFKARLKIIEKRVIKIVRGLNKPGIKILNVGVATGLTTNMLEKYGDVISVEYDKDCCKFLEETVGIKAINASLTDLPFNNNNFDLICAFDVIEHIEDDLKALDEIRRVLSDDGFFFITIPAFNFLWSKHDEINHHYRRYNLKELTKKIQKSNMAVNFQSYFNFWLFTPILITRLLFNIFPRRNKEDTSGSDFELSGNSKIINKILYLVFLSENILIKNNIKLPFGLSLLVTGRKMGNRQ